MELCEKLEAALNQYIRPATYPVAVKLSAEPVLPPKAKRPMTTLGHRINLCQGVAMVRRYGWTMGFLKEDHGCGNSQVIMGICEEPDFIKDGSICYPLYTKDLETGVKTQQATPKLPMGMANAILMAPLHKADFMPDVILIYCNPGQAVRLIQGALYHEGGSIESKFMGRAACGAEIVVPIKTGKCNVIIPGGGEKVFAMPSDDELIFSLPAGKAEELIIGLEETHKAGAARYPAPFFGLRAEPTFPAVYDALDRYTGIVK
jgi:uncharacterized protein (DUF169 family)